MELDHEACYRAIQTRDARFDGRFFTGVTTTFIYCRPVCPARTPRRENVRFFASAAAAEEAGFRACLRCRPETSPEAGAGRGACRTVSRALGLIENDALCDGNVDALAERLGVGGPELRRLFQQHLGASPLGVAQTRRVLLAKQLWTGDATRPRPRGGAPRPGLPQRKQTARPDPGPTAGGIGREQRST